jgi:hypothetical protein
MVNARIAREAKSSNSDRGRDDENDDDKDDGVDRNKKGGE